ncbi:hypothetical protein [Pyxidicoccus trucidator]|uniref:hypothetical protein n=1 Tax=Pyxidicoccus trucidator TaxID=2709662 RepID=UPI0013DAF890|nr:hypothetical protein [Pyxidicoccus trucidator]
MPSIFDDGTLGPHIRRLHCPPFDGKTVEAACKAQEQALLARHRSQLEETARQVEQDVRARAAQELRDAVWDSRWGMGPGGPLLLADPGTLPVPIQGEVAHLRGTLPRELTQLVESALLGGEAKLDLARRFGARLGDYNVLVARNIEEARARTFQPILQRHRGEHVDLTERLKEAVARWKKSQEPRPPQGMGSASSLSFIPSNTFNTVSSQPRYFRILVWNLENFTRDRRPRGAQPLDSMRNAARTAIVADVLARFDIDLLLMMETGTDVGTVTTRIATRVAEKVRDRRGWEPLVSPPTGALPEVRASYANHSLGRPSGLKAVALRTLFDVYVVTPRYDGVPGAVTGQQLVDAWATLCTASPEVGHHLRGFLEFTAEQAMVRGAPSYELFMKLVGLLERTAMQVASTVGGSLDQDVRMVHDALHSVVNELANGDLQTGLSHLAYAVLSARDAIAELYDIEVEQSFQQDIIDQGIGCLQALELLTLFLIKSQPGGIPTTGIEGRVFRSDSTQYCLIPLAVFLCTGAQRVTMKAIDRKQGPMNGELDDDVLLDALQRIGAVERHIETYGMVYRQPFDGALRTLIERGVSSHGFSGGTDQAAARYGIIRAPLAGGGFSIQAAGGLLNWRSALQITVPASSTVLLPLVVYHTRYSGTAEISGMEPDLTAAENTILARCRSVEMMAGAVLPGDPALGPPLIAGDFNVPDEYLNQEPPPKSKAKKTLEAYARRTRMRQGFFGNMALSGYLRHSTDGRPDDGYPATTLKAYSSIARGDGAESEPYDGTYQPFDYGRGRASPSSGVVQVSGLLVDSVMGEKITGIPSQATGGQVVDPDAGEAEDVGGDAPDLPGDDAPSGLVTWPVAQALGVELGRVYRGLLRRIYRAIEDLKPWMGAIGAKNPSVELLTFIFQINELYEAWDKLVGPRVEWFVKNCANGATGKWAAASGSDAMLTWRKLFVDAATQQKTDRIGGTGLADLVDLVDDVGVQLAALETGMQVRQLIAYRAVVSDHLPQLIEIDLQPS